MPVTVGMQGRAQAVVCKENTAVTADSGTLPVFATPFLCALMEKASWTCVAPALLEGESTVGTKLNISHDSATPVGLKVWAESRVTLVDGKRIEFSVTAYDEKGPIGSGTHERFVVTDERFLAKAAKKQEG